MTTTFADLGVPDALVTALDREGIAEPFPIQAATIPDALAGRDLCGKAPTGSGKTIAFGIPLLARVKRAAPKRPKGLVLAPTRELALQVADQLRALSNDVRVLAVYGGAGIEPQIKALRAGVDIVVACPGRLLDLIDRNVVDLRDVSFVVIDEADRMADMGFLPDVRRLLDDTNPVRQTLLFSATLDGAVDQLVRDYQVNPAIHEMAEEHAGDITHHFWQLERTAKVELVASLVERAGPTVVFCRTKHGSDRVARQLGNAGVKAAAIHGNRSQAQRERALAAFHRGEVQALVATDVAARGIHVEGVTAVIHFDLPADPKDYIHRSGRTGRAGTDGTVVALLDAGQRKDAVKLKKAAGVDAEIAAPDVAAIPEGPQQRFRPEPRRSAGGGRPGGGGSRPARSGSGRPAAQGARADRQGGKRPGPRSGRPDGSPTRRPRRDGAPGERSRGGAGAGDRASSSGGGRRRTGAEANRDERRAGWPDRPEGGRGPGSGAKRRAASRPGKRERAEARAAGDGRRSDRGAAPAGRGPRSAADVPAGFGGEKVRQSGASRRKAAKAARAAAGIEELPKDLRRR